MQINSSTSVCLNPFFFFFAFGDLLNLSEPKLAILVKPDRNAKGWKHRSKSKREKKYSVFFPVISRVLGRGIVIISPPQSAKASKKTVMLRDERANSLPASLSPHSLPPLFVVLQRAHWLPPEIS